MKRVFLVPVVATTAALLVLWIAHSTEESRAEAGIDASKIPKPPWSNLISSRGDDEPDEMEPDTPPPLPSKLTILVHADGSFSHDWGNLRAAQTFADMDALKAYLKPAEGKKPSMVILKNKTKEVSAKRLAEVADAIRDVADVYQDHQREPEKKDKE